MSDMNALHPVYANEAGWRRINAMLPEALRLDSSNVPTEE